jgi:DNA polymerase I
MTCFRWDDEGLFVASSTSLSREFLVMWTVYDVEADKLELHEVNHVWCICAHELFTGENYEWGPDEIPQAVEFLNKSKRLIAHNQVWFDLEVLKKLFGLEYKGTVIDTLILSRLANPDRQRPFDYQGKAGPHSLEVWAHRLGMPEKIQHEDWSKFSPEMLERCKRDVATNVAVYKALYRELV